VNYYVYCYFDGEVPIYIGTGRGRRDVSHLCGAKGCPYFHNKLRKMQREGAKPIVRRLLEGLTFRESRDWECFFIRAVGRKNYESDGTLYNLTCGGEGTPGYKHTETAKQRMLEACARPEVKQRKLAAQKAANARPEVRQRKSEAQKAAQNRPEVNQQRSEAAKAAGARPEVKQRRSEAAKAANARPEVRQRKSEAAKVAQNRPEVKQRNSGIQKVAQNRPEVKQRNREASRHRPPKGRFKGVQPHRKKWRATIDGKHLGIFPTPEQAAIAYNDAVDKYWGGDGWKNRVQNVPVSVERRLTSVKSVVCL